MKLLSKQQTRSLGLAVLPFFTSLIIKFLYLTNKKIFHAPQSLGDDNFIMACWHGQLLMIPYAYTHFRKKPKVKLLISEHFDGDLIAKTLSFFGFLTIRGSSTRGGVKALLSGIKDIKAGYDLGITPDGPKGPRQEVRDGIIVMAQKAKVKIVLVEIKPSRYWQVNSWDKFVVPKPFGEIEYFISEPIDVSGMGMDDAKKLIKEGMLKNEY